MISKFNQNTFVHSLYLYLMNLYIVRNYMDPCNDYFKNYI